MTSKRIVKDLKAIADFFISESQGAVPVALEEAIKIIEQYPCNDCISREAAKKELEDRFMELQKRHSENRYETNFCLNTILELPPVTPSRPRGKWLDKKMTIKGAHGMAYGRYACSVCKKKFPTKSNYCPNCGAEMEGEE